MIIREGKQKNILSAFSLVELLVAMTILILVIGALFSLMNSGREVWTVNDTKIGLQSTLRSVRDRLSSELEQSGSDQNSNMKVTVTQAAGNNNSDVIRFSIPIICQSGGKILDNNANVSYWGAPLTYGCNDYSCMDADNNCGTIDYTSLEYRINSDKQMERRVYNSLGNIARTDVVGMNLSDFQAVLDSTNNYLTITLNVSGISTNKRIVTMADTFNVYLRNKR
ncbi:MAG: hypothetical protein HQL25_08280 [Candidatus Omnitrophica bacterium]|nr:hypothetical protein [Candidatus Omnitrophota bacterium]